MISKILSAAVVGLEAVPIEVEVDISSGLPAFSIVGLPDKAVEESKERVRAALKNSGAQMPSKRLTVNLAPADIKKEGPGFDLPIAIGLLASSGQIPLPQIEKVLFVGELSLDGHLKPVNGLLSICLAAKKKGVDTIFLPQNNLLEATLTQELNLYPVKSLRQLINHLKGENKIRKFKPKTQLKAGPPEIFEYDFAYIKGQENAKRALEIAAAGQHNVLMVGPPGSGKTLLARSFPSIMPLLTKDELLDIIKIYSVSGALKREELIQQRPFRSPHHTSSDIALVGGGQHPRPGEITLAHHGVLFLDELPEFDRSVLESLRQPLEDGVITVSRAAGSLQFPARFTLIAAMNPCPCGFLNDPQKPCHCTPSQIIKYQKKISGPLLDRIDLYLEVPRLKYEKLTDKKVAEESKKVRERVEKARKKQRKRFTQHKVKYNSQMQLPEIKQYCKIDKVGENILKESVNQFNLSARGYFKILKLARTIADLEESENIKSIHLAEALQYRPKEISY